MDFNVNIWSVLVAGFISTILGAVWYSPLMFGNLWMKLSGIKKPTGKALEKAKKEMWKSMLVALIGSFIGAYTIGVLIINMNLIGWISGAILGCIIGFGIIATRYLDSVLWEGKPVQLYLLNISYGIVSYTLIGAIIGLSCWR